MLIKSQSTSVTEVLRVITKVSVHQMGLKFLNLETRRFSCLNCKPLGSKTFTKLPVKVRVDQRFSSNNSRIVLIAFNNSSEIPLECSLFKRTGCDLHLFYCICLFYSSFSFVRPMPSQTCDRSVRRTVSAIKWIAGRLTARTVE